MNHGSLSFLSASWFLPKRAHTKARSNLSPTSGDLSFEHPRHPFLLHLCSSLWYPLVINHDGLLFAHNIYVHGEEKNARAALPTFSSSFLKSLNSSLMWMSWVRSQSEFARHDPRPPLTLDTAVGYSSVLNLCPLCSNPLRHQGSSARR